MIESKLKTSYGDVHYWISENLNADRITLFFLHGLTDNLYGEKREIIEDYLIKYDKDYIGSKYKDFLINEVARQFENNDNPFRKYGSDYNDSMSQVWESYRRKFMSEKD